MLRAYPVDGAERSGVARVEDVLVVGIRVAGVGVGVVVAEDRPVTVANKRGVVSVSDNLDAKVGG